jgi:hypothetical protein
LADGARSPILCRVPPIAAIPAPLAHAPFSLGQAAAAGLTRAQRRGANWQRLGPGIYIRRGRTPDPLDLLTAVADRLPPEAAFSGETAAWLDGLELDPISPIDVTLPRGSTVSSRVGLRIHRCALRPIDVTVRQGLRTTATPRTLADLARRLSLEEAVAVIDMALHAERVDFAGAAAYVADHPRARGIARLRAALELADGRAESRMESLLRVLLVRSGLPRPESQADLFDSEGNQFARADLYYPAARLVIEFDGAGHRDNLTYDLRRQNQLLRAGYTLLRFTAADVFGRPQAVAALVSAALLAHRRPSAPGNFQI